MSGVQTIPVGDGDDGVRVDRWFKNRYPGLTHVRLQKLLRSGQVRVNGKRVKSNTRLEKGQQLRIPPLAKEKVKDKSAAPKTSKADSRDLRARVIHKDDDIIVIDKPAGLAVQGGSGIRKHLDAMLDALCFDAPERPRLVHRLDKDTSGVLVLARNPVAARTLTAAFREKKIRKVYWAVVVGVPQPEEGMINLDLAKVSGRGGERVVTGSPDGKKAQTYFRILDHAGQKAAWVVFEPLTGRTHQLRVHAIALGTPILGDGKYGGREAFLDGGKISGQLHLHARAMRIPQAKGAVLEVTAPLPEHFTNTFKALGFNEKLEQELFKNFNEIA